MSAPPSIRPGATRRLEVHTSNFAAATYHLSAGDVGELLQMLMAEVGMMSVPNPSNDFVSSAFCERRAYSRIKGSFGRENLPISTRREVFHRDLETCRYCGVALTWETYHCDHIHPVSRGGCDDLKNLAASCGRCNRSKAAKTLKEWGAAR